MRGGLQRNGFSWLVKEFLIQIMHCSSRVLRAAHIFQAQKVWSMRRKSWYSCLSLWEESLEKLYVKGISSIAILLRHFIG